MVHPIGEIIDACLQLPKKLYQEEGLAFAIAGTLVMPFAVPVAAAFYYQIDEQHRQILDEWGDG